MSVIQTAYTGHMVRIHRAMKKVFELRCITGVAAAPGAGGIVSVVANTSRLLGTGMKGCACISLDSTS
jgi:hypothetical protein